MSIWDKSVTFTRKARFFLREHLLIARCLGRHVPSHHVVALLSARWKLKIPCQKIQPFDLDILRRAVKVHSQEWPRMLADDFEAGGCGAGRGPPRKPSGPPRRSGMLAGVLASIRSTPFAHGVPRHHWHLWTSRHSTNGHEGGTEVAIWAHVHGTSL